MSEYIIRIINPNETPLGFAIKRSSDNYYLGSLPNTFSSGVMLGSPYPLTQLSGYKTSVFRYSLDTSNYNTGDYVAYILDMRSLAIQAVLGMSV